jgi:hypothetical protein
MVWLWYLRVPACGSRPRYTRLAPRANPAFRTIITIHRLVRPAFFAGVFTDFFAAFLVVIFLVGDFFAAVFFAAFFAGALWGALLTGAFFANGSDAFLAGVSASVTVATAPPNAVLTEPATSSAIARPYPTFSAAFSNIVFSAIFGSLHDVRLALRIVAVYPRSRTNLCHSAHNSHTGCCDDEVLLGFEKEGIDLGIQWHKRHPRYRFSSMNRSANSNPDGCGKALVAHK